MGTGQALREANPAVKIIAAEPLQGDAVMGLRSLEDGYTPEILDVSKLDRRLLVTNADALVGLRALLDERASGRASPPVPSSRSPAASPRRWRPTRTSSACSPTAAGNMRRPVSGVATPTSSKSDMETGSGGSRRAAAAPAQIADEIAGTPGRGSPTRPAASSPASTPPRRASIRP